MSSLKLSKLPPPAVKETLDFEDILAKKKKQLKELYPAWNADVESDPTVASLEVSAYREMLGRQRVNDAALAVMLPWSHGTDLENIASFFNLKREVIQPGDDSVIPPVLPVYESNDSLRERCLLAWHGLSTAGPRKSYIFHAHSASPKVKDANAYRVKGGVIAVVVLSHGGDGTADSDVLAAVSDHVSDEDARPLCVEASVKSAVIHSYSIEAELELDNVTAKDSILQQALKNTQQYTDEQHRIGALVSRSALDAAIHISGVVNVDLKGFDNFQADKETAPFCEKITIKVKGGTDVIEFASS